MSDQTNADPTRYFATCSTGVEQILADELTELGASNAKAVFRGVGFNATRDVAYNCMLWSRVATRIYQPLFRHQIADDDALYQWLVTLDWSSHLGLRHPFAIDVRGSHKAFKNATYAALKAKDAIVDAIRRVKDARPNIAKESELRLYLHLSDRECEIGIDLAGKSMHRRGYRAAQGAAPIRETLAAAMLYRLGWPAIAKSGGALVDPMCGAGTFLLEGAMMAADRAPGLELNPGARHWKQFDLALWNELVDQARTRAEAGEGNLDNIFLLGFDSDKSAIYKAKQNAQSAGLDDAIRFENRPLHELSARVGDLAPGLIVTNPPYGQRLGGPGQAADQMRVLGDQLRDLTGWRVGLITDDIEHGFELSARPPVKLAVDNGGQDCVVLDLGELDESSVRQVEVAEDLANRLRKNLAAIEDYVERNQIECYRIYDADMPEYAAAIDIYAGQLLIQEYAAPKNIPVGVTKGRLRKLIATVQSVCEIPPHQTIVKVRQKQKGAAQYDKRGDMGEFMWIREGGLEFQVNLHDFLDTGLFLDHRETRSLVREWLEPGQSFLNLFCYTGSVSVYAAAAGAKTTSIDLSNTYVEWAQRNLEHNGFSGWEHRVLRDDCMAWLAKSDHSYDLIFLDPPTFSNSKKMESILDIQRDHAHLIRLCMRRLNPGGKLFFSNNARKFVLDESVKADYHVTEMTEQTVPPDFNRRSPHQSWKIQAKSAA